MPFCQSTSSKTKERKVTRQSCSLYLEHQNVFSGRLFVVNSLLSAIDWLLLLLLFFNTIYQSFELSKAYQEFVSLNAFNAEHT